MRAPKLASWPKNINDMLGTNKEQLSRIIDDTDQTMILFQKTLKNVDDVVGDEKLKTDLKQTIGNMPQLLGETRDTITGMQKTYGPGQRQPAEHANRHQGPRRTGRRHGQ